MEDCYCYKETPGDASDTASGARSSPRDFQVNFGFYNFTLDPISISKITFDFWENDGLIGDDKLVNDVVLTLPQPFVLQPTKMDFKLKFTFSLGGEVTDVDFDPEVQAAAACEDSFLYVHRI